MTRESVECECKSQVCATGGDGGRRPRTRRHCFCSRSIASRSCSSMSVPCSAPHVRVLAEHDARMEARTRRKQGHSSTGTHTDDRSYQYWLAVRTPPCMLYLPSRAVPSPPLVQRERRPSISTRLAPPSCPPRCTQVVCFSPSSSTWRVDSNTYWLSRLPGPLPRRRHSFTQHHTHSRWLNTAVLRAGLRHRDLDADIVCLRQLRRTTPILDHSSLAAAPVRYRTLLEDNCT